jgi:hypothetical protein
MFVSQISCVDDDILPRKVALLYSRRPSLKLWQLHGPRLPPATLWNENDFLANASHSKTAALRVAAADGGHRQMNSMAVANAP